MNRIAAYSLLALLCVPVPGSSASRAVPATGDLVFQGMGSSSQGKAIQLATRSPYSHMGMIFLKGGNYYVLEAVGPVKYTPLKTWIRQGEGGHYVVRRLKDADRILTAQAVGKLRKEAGKYLGKPYDHHFGWSDKRIYCSELVWKVYRNALGIEIARPTKLREFDLGHPLVKEKLKERYGDAVPLDEPVISPGQIFRSEMLETVASH